MNLSEEHSINPSASIESSHTRPSTITNVQSPSSSYVYAIGRITPRFTNLAIEKEFAQVSGRTETIGQTNREVLQDVLKDPANRYLVRHLCWILTIEGLETYLLRPRDPVDFNLLVESLRPTPSPTDMDVVIGLLGPIAPADLCSGLMIPIVAFDQIYSFDRDSFIETVPKPEVISEEQEKQFQSAVAELFDRIMQLADNAGATDDHRALNYIAVRYPAIYTQAFDAFERKFLLTSVEVHPSRLSGVRNIVDIIFSYASRQTDVTEKFFVRVDVTEEFPFLVTKLSHYFDR